MSDILQETDKMIKRGINYLVFYRFLVLIFLVGIVFFLEHQTAGGLAEIYPHYYYIVVISAGILNLIHWWINQVKISPHLHLYTQISLDLLIITSMVYVTGGISSIYPVLYQLVIIYAVFFSGKAGGLYSASGASILYGLLIDAEYLKFIPSFSGQMVDGVITTGTVLFRICLYILSFYVTAALAIFLVERERRATRLLAESEKAFQDLSRLYQSIVESVNTGIITIDRRGNIKTFNRAAAQITGLKVEKVLNTSIYEIFDSLKEAPNEEKNELLYTTPDGKRLILGYSRSPLKNDQGNEIGEIILLLDLTDIRRMQEEAKKNERLAFIGQMAANLAHEFRNPLMSMSGSIQMLQRSLPLGEEEQRLMEIIMRARDRLEAVIRDFLFLSRQKKREVEQLNLPSLVEELIDMIKNEIDQSKDVAFDFRTEGHIFFSGNREEFRHLVYNLLINAVQAVGERGEIKIFIGEIRDKGGNFVKMEIEDNGCGIPEEEIGYIFEPFYTTKNKGTGLGLSIVSAIVQTYGGTVEVESHPGRSTRFTVKLPTA